MDFIHSYASPLGQITVASDGEAVLGLWFDGQKYDRDVLGKEYKEAALPIFGEADRWLDQYFAGLAPNFTPKLNLRGTAFRRRVWDILLEIPYGQTMTYGEIADRIARERGLKRMSARAVGGAVGHNPISLIVPCHRALGAQGRLTGYAGGLDRKAWLLRREGIIPHEPPRSAAGSAWLRPAVRAETVGPRGRMRR